MTKANWALRLFTDGKKLENTGVAMSMSTATDLSCNGWMETNWTLGLLLRVELHHFDEFPRNRKIRIVFERLQFKLAAVADHELRVCLNEVLLKWMTFVSEVEFYLCTSRPFERIVTSSMVRRCCV